MNHHELKLDSNKLGDIDSTTNQDTAEGHRLDNLPVPSMPWRPCTNFKFRNQPGSALIYHAVWKTGYLYILQLHAVAFQARL